jgi:hypothetical protein
MRVITSFFSIESLRPVLDHPVDCAPNDSTPAAVKGAMNAHRDWLGLQEGENRIALLGESIPRRRQTHGKAHLKVLFSTMLIE